MKHKILTVGLVSSCLLLGLVTVTSPVLATESPITSSDLSQYQFSQTKSLVRFVRSAAVLFHKEGDKAFSKFKKRGGKWNYKNRYLFIYDLQGRNIFHASEADLEGKDLLAFKDLGGRKVIQDMIKAVNNKKHPEGWVHYLWVGPDHLFPSWKSSYVMRVTAPNGKAYFIGSGIYDMRMERVFVKHLVRKVINYLEKNGLSALSDLSDNNRHFLVKDSYPFILNMKGEVVYDPAFPINSPNPGYNVRRNLLSFKDASGRYIVKEILEKLKNKSSAWVMFLWPEPHQTKLARKMIYVQRVKINGQELIVGSELRIDVPIWMD